MGGTMRLGADPIKLHEGTRAREIYGEAVIYERHRHRYEVNNFLRQRLEAAGLVISGTSPDERLVEILEIADHPFFVASQFHPEFKSRPERPAPLFREFVARGAARARTSSARRSGTRCRPPGRTRRPRAPSSATRIELDRRADRALHPDAAAERRASPPRGRAGAARRDVRRAVPHPSPFGHERACAERVAAELRGMGIDVEEDDAAAAAGAECGNLLARMPGRVGSHDPALRPPRHGRGDRADRPGGRRRRLGERQRRHPRRRQQGGGRGDARGRRGARRSRARRSGSSCCSPSPRRTRWPAPRRSTPAGCAREFGYVFDHAAPDRRGRHRLADLLPPQRRVPRPRRARRHPPGGRPQRDPRRGARDRRDAAWARRRARRRRTSARSPAASGSTNVVPERCRLLAEARSLDAERVETVVAQMVDAVHDGAAFAECDVDLVVEKLFDGYRTRPSAPAVVAAEAALRACGYEPRRDRHRRRVGRQRADRRGLRVRQPRQRDRAQPRADRARLRGGAGRDARRRLRAARRGRRGVARRQAPVALRRRRGDDGGSSAGSRSRPPELSLASCPLHDSRFERIGSELVYEGKLVTVRKDEFRHEDGDEVTREIVAPPGRGRRRRPRRRAALPRPPAARGDRRARLPRAAGRQARRRGRAAARDRQARAGRGDRQGGRATGSRCRATTPRPGFTDEEVHVFLATGLTDAGAETDENERIDIVTHPLADLDALIDEVHDAKTLIGLLRAAPPSRRLNAGLQPGRRRGRSAANSTAWPSPRPAPSRSSTWCSTSSPTSSSSAGCRATRSRPTGPTCCSSAPGSGAPTSTRCRSATPSSPPSSPSWPPRRRTVRPRRRRRCSARSRASVPSTATSAARGRSPTIPPSTSRRRVRAASCRPC